ncbi:MAG: deoxyribose-phosphate aldolase [Actinomycetota bacterium]|nr:deoxyribose-phosphate aldolase [Actinomycetota bacterium]
MTTLEPDDTSEKVAHLAARALRPDPASADVPSVAALCTWSRLIPAAEALRGSGVRLAAVAGDFPAGTAPTGDKVREIEEALAAGAEEVDAVINRAMLRDGDLEGGYQEVVALRRAAGDATLKVILETGELEDLHLIRAASLVALAGGADFIKTSTGKLVPGATAEATVVMADAIKDFYARTAQARGLKVAGGVRTSEDALRYIHIVVETLGSEWFAPQRFRIGASSLLDDLIARL